MACAREIVHKPSSHPGSADRQRDVPSWSGTARDSRDVPAGVAGCVAQRWLPDRGSRRLDPPACLIRRLLAHAPGVLRSHRGMSAHLRARLRCINMQPVNDVIGVCANPCRRRVKTLVAARIAASAGTAGRRLRQAWQRQPSMLAQPGTAVDELGGLSQTDAPRLSQNRRDGVTGRGWCARRVGTGRLDAGMAKRTVRPP